MGQKTWRVPVGERSHVVELDHGFFSGKVVVKLDGRTVVDRGSNVLDTGGSHPFKIGETECAAVVRTNGLWFNYDLVVGGRSASGGPVAAGDVAGPIPAWGWLFAGACGVIPILTMGGAVPAAIGFGGAGGCVAVSRDATKPVAARVVICVAITAGCWVLFLALFAAALKASGRF